MNNCIVFPDNDKTGACILSTYLQDCSGQYNEDRLKILLSEGIQSPINEDRLAEIKQVYEEMRNTALTVDYIDNRTEAASNLPTKMFVGLKDDDFRIQTKLSLIPCRIPQWAKKSTAGVILYKLPNHRGAVIDSISIEIPSTLPRPEKVSIESNNREILAYTGPILDQWTWRPFPDGFPGYLSPYSQMDVVMTFPSDQLDLEAAIKVWATVLMPCTDESEVREPSKTMPTTFVKTEVPNTFVCVSHGVAIPCGTTV